MLRVWVCAEWKYLWESQLGAGDETETQKLLPGIFCQHLPYVGFRYVCSSRDKDATAGLAGWNYFLIGSRSL